MADDNLSIRNDELNKKKSEEAAILMQEQTMLINNQGQTVSLIDNINDNNNEEEDEDELKPMDCMQTNLFSGKENKKREDEEENEPPIFLTTWEDVRTGQLLAYSIGFGQMGNEVHDVSHLNITRDEFMANALPIIQGGGSPENIQAALDKEFPSQKTYPSFSSFQSMILDKDESSTDLDETTSQNKSISL